MTLYLLSTPLIPSVSIIIKQKNRSHLSMFEWENGYCGTEVLLMLCTEAIWKGISDSWVHFPPIYWMKCRMQLNFQVRWLVLVASELQYYNTQICYFFWQERCGFKFDWTQVQPTGVPVAYNALYELFGATWFSPFSGLGGSHNSTNTSTYLSCFSLACCCGNLLWCNINSATNLVPQDEKSSICTCTLPF